MEPPLVTTPALTRRSALGLAGGTAGALLAGLTSPADAAAGWRTLVVVTANVGRRHLDRREPAIRAVRRAVKRNGSPFPPLVGFQEIGEGDDDGREAGWIREYFGSSFTKLFNQGGDRSHRVPIVAPGFLDVKGSRDTFVHEGRSNVTPPRFINEAVLAADADPQLRFAFLNTHYVAGAWNGRQDSHETWRKRRWNDHFDRHQARIASYHRRGLPVIWTGDVNRTPMPALHPDERRVFDTGIDQIRWIPGSNGTKIRLVRSGAVNMSVDSHNARFAVFQVRHR